MFINRKRLLSRAADVDQQHREGMTTLRSELEEVHFGETGAMLRDSRRSFLAKAGAGGAAITLAGIAVPVTRLIPAARAQELTDLDIAVFAESVELAAVAAYTVAAESGKLDPAVVEVGTMFAGHHQEHAGAFAGIAGDAATGQPNQAVLDVFGPMLQAAEDQAALLEIAYQLEEGAAATYMFGLGALQSAEAAGAVATILPVESQHAVVLGEALGKDLSAYMPSFETQQGALDPAEFPVNA